jgi:UDP-N-acetylglucosamine 2-epimerase (non-hydrolysing)
MRRERDRREHQKMVGAVNPYGDGKAAERIIQAMRNYFGISNEPVEEFTP